MANDWRELVDEVLALQDDPSMKTAPGPSIQWYPQQWLGDAAVQLMGFEARGMHHHLLMTAWKGFDLDEDAVPCSLPENPDLLAVLCQRPAEWPALWAQISRAWKARKGRLWNLGLCRSYLYQMSRRRGSKKAADARWGKAHGGADAIASKSDAVASVSLCIPTPTSSPSSTPRGSPPLPPIQGEERDLPEPDPDYLLSTNPGERPYVHQETSKGTLAPRCGRRGTYVPVSGEWPKGGRRCKGCDSASGRLAVVYPQDFEDFMAIYPKPRNKPAAFVAWGLAEADRPQNGKLLASVRAWAGSREWTKDEGDFIPSPEKYLAGHMWNDSPGAKVPKARTMAEIYPAAAKKVGG